MKVLITGGAGYIGSILVEKLLEWQQSYGPNLSEKDYVVKKLTVVDNLVRKQNTMGRFVTDPRFEFIKSNIAESFKYNGSIEKFRDEEVGLDELILLDEYDFVIPLAGVVGAPRCQADFHMAWRYNFYAIQGLLAILTENANREVKVIYPCTNSGYGSRLDGKMVTEDDPLSPVSVYGRSKVAAEKEVLDFGGISLRLATVMGYSPCMRLDLLVNDFTWKAVKERTLVLYEKHFSRNYIHVEDVVQAFILAIDNYDKMKGQSFNVGLSSANLTKAELSKKIAEHTELHIVEAPFMEDPDKRDYIVSNEKIENMGFRPGWDIDRTIEQLIKFYNTVTLDSANIYYENWK